MLENNFICGATSNNFEAKIFGRNFVASKSALEKSSQIGQDSSGNHHEHHHHHHKHSSAPAAK